MAEFDFEQPVSMEKMRAFVYAVRGKDEMK